MTTLTLAKFAIPDPTTLARVIAHDLGIAVTFADPPSARDRQIADELYVDLTEAPRTAVVDVCDFYLGHHPEIRWRLT